MRRKILDAVNSALKVFGVKLARLSNAARFEMCESLQHLIDKGCRPATCIDVGVAHGTIPIYSAFPDAAHLLIEPLSEYEPEIRCCMEKYDCYYVQAAAGCSPGKVTIHIKDQITGSSIFCEQPDVPQGQAREVEVVTLDQICSERSLKGPYLVKIDVEGAEMEVIKGASTVIHDTLALILELTFVARLVDAPEAGEVIRFMADRGFVLYDIFGLRLRQDKALFQADAVFVPEDSPYRK